MRRRLALPSRLAALLLLAAGCSTGDTLDPFDLVGKPPTSIRVDPSTFLGDDVGCAAVPGAMQSYVATPFDITDDKALPSSPPIACSATVQFRDIVVGHEYRIEIDGYDVAAADLVPEGGSSSGSRKLVLRASPGAGAVDAPWKTSCAGAEMKPLLAEADVQLLIKECAPLSASSTETGIGLDPRATLEGAGSPPSGDLRCKADGMGEVASFDVLPDDPSLPPLLNLPCVTGGAAPAPYAQGIAVGKLYTFRVEARAEPGGPVVWGASCSAIPSAGVVVSAVCDPLNAKGALDVGLDEAALAAAGLACGADGVASFDVALPSPASLSAVGVTCGKSVRFGPLAPGSYGAQIAAKNAAGEVVFQTSCTGSVAPGGVAVCAP
jgi:hypothetical protein